jgi:hypothetical protein
VDANVTNAKLASGIDASKLTTGTLPIARIADGAVSAAKLAAKVTFPNYGAISTITYVSGQNYQAATDGFIQVNAFGSFRNGVAIRVGLTSPATHLVWVSGNNVNSNNWSVSSGLIPVPKDAYYRIDDDNSAGNTEFFETVNVYWFPVIA